MRTAELIVIGAGGTASWSAILVATLGSSALGAVLGGYLTTRMRGRIEREEAWRTRLIETAEDLNGVLVQTARTLGGFLPRAARGEHPLRKPDGTLTDEAAAGVQTASDLCVQAEASLARFELMFGVETEAYQHGFQTMNLLQRATGLVEGRGSAQLLIRAFCAERETPGSGNSLLAAEDMWRAMRPMELLALRDHLPDEFDPSDDANVANWARELHHVAGESLHDYIRTAHQQITQYGEH
jgi:hypothetical protein